MKKTILIAMTGFSMLFAGCGGGQQKTTEKQTEADTVPADFKYEVDEFADLQILRYYVPGFNNLTLQEKELVYYLSMAALEGRDILFDQNNKYNLAIRRVLEAIYTNYKGDKNSQDYKEFEVYLKRVWFSNGIHHHYGGEEKFLPGFSKEFFREQVLALPDSLIPRDYYRGGQAEYVSAENFVSMITPPVMFDPAVMAKKSESIRWRSDSDFSQ